MVTPAALNTETPELCVCCDREAVILVDDEPHCAEHAVKAATARLLREDQQQRDEREKGIR